MDIQETALRLRAACRGFGYQVSDDDVLATIKSILEVFSSSQRPESTDPVGPIAE